MTESDDVECLYCMDQGTVKRRYGTAEGGPAKIVKERPCPLCGDDSEERRRSL